MEYNIYCDESCHLRRNDEKVMVLGALMCSKIRRREISRRVREIKMAHGFNPAFEIKMNKVSPGKMRFYLDLLDYFFDNDDLHFRAVVIPDKTTLLQEDFRQTHDGVYYKMLFNLVRILLDPRNAYHIYIDRKDSHSGEKARELHRILCNSHYDFQQSIIRQVKPVHSHESELLQLCDLLTGLIAYVNRGLVGNAAKLALIDRMRKRSGYTLMKTTLFKEQKVNLLIWKPKEEETEQ
jgi:hypothetical protein